MNNTKPALRTLYLEKRKALESDSREDLSFSIANQCLKLPIWDYQYFHLYLPLTEKAEIDTTLILTLLQGRDKAVFVPKIKSPSVLEHILLTDQTKIQKNKWEIPEPESGITIAPNELEVVFIPLLAFDLKGHRVGYGKGFYDRFLSQCKPSVVKIGLSFFDPITTIIDTNSYDIRLDYCVSPERIYRFSS